MANEIRTLINSQPGLKNDWKQDWKEDAKLDWKVDWASDAAAAPVNTVAPAITGTATSGQTLTTTNGTWTGSGITYTRAWFRGASTTPVAGQTANTYVLGTDDVGVTIRCRVTATNAAGVVSVFTAATATVAAA